MGLLLGGGGIIHGHTSTGGNNEKISIRFRSNVSWCWIDVCVDAWGSEGGGVKDGKKLIMTCLSLTKRVRFP